VTTPGDSSNFVVVVFGIRLSITDAGRTGDVPVAILPLKPNLPPPTTLPTPAAASAAAAELVPVHLCAWLPALPRLGGDGRFC
jgi:hypothetical protein